MVERYPLNIHIYKKKLILLLIRGNNTKLDGKSKRFTDRNGSCAPGIAAMKVSWLIYHKETGVISKSLKQVSYV